MKKILCSVILIVLISLILGAEGLQDSLVSDGFNDEYLSEKWTEINEGNGGIITEDYSSILGPYVKFVTANPNEPPYVYNDAKVGIYREFPSKIIDLLSTGPGEFRVTLKRYPDESNGENSYGALRIDFGEGRFIEVRQSRETDSNTNKYHRIQRYYNENGFIYESYSVGTYSYEYSNIVIEKRINGHFYIKDVYSDNYIDVGEIPDIQSISLYSYAEVPNNASTSMTYFECYPDINDLFEVTSTPNRLYYEQDNFMQVYVDNSYTGEDFADAKITILNHNFQNVYGPQNVESDGTLNITLHPQDEDSIKYYMIAENTHYVGQIDTFEIPIITRQLFYECSEEIPAIDNTEYEIFVYEEELLPYPEGTVKHPINDAYVSVSNGYDILEEGYTGADGKVSFNLYTKHTDDINIIVDKDGGYTPKTDQIMPYVWSRTSSAFGKNNQTNLVRETGTDNTAMLYSLGDTLVFGVSDDFGKTWFVDYITYDHDDNPLTDDILAMGTDPVLTTIDGGYLAVWKNGLYLNYTTMRSPWTPIDTVNSPTTIWHSEAAINQNSDNSIKYGAYINHRSTFEDKGDLIFDKWLSSEYPELEGEIVIHRDGSAGATPQCSPLVAGYLQLAGESYLAGCIDMDNRVAYSLWLFGEMEWERARFADNEGQYCLNPSIDFNGYNTTFVWEVDNGDNTKDIWERKITPYGIEEAKQVSVTDGINSYAKNRDNELYTYVNNDNTLIDYRDGYSDPLNPITYTLYEGNDSLHSYSVNVRPVKMNTEALYAITEGSNGNYKINFINKTYESWMPRALTVVPADTIIIGAKESPISNYVNGSFPVERMSVDIPIVDNGLADMVELTTDDKNPHIPQVIMIDGEVMGVIYGGNEVKETDIEIPSYMRDDNMITVTVDRMKGNPNRTTEIALYEYETEQAQTVKNNQIAFKPQTSNNKLQTFMTINHKLSTINLKYSIPQSGYVNLRIFDISGRVVETVQSGQLNKGIYSYNTKQTRSGVYFAVMEYNNKVYKEKFIIVK